jgi:DNA-binding GntR family transcriptional regulator
VTTAAADHGAAEPGATQHGATQHGGVASHRIADALRTAILDGSYRPGERIRQEDVAARSGASRIPVREALRLLQAEGLVTLVANSGAWVAKLTLAECAELYQIRERLEPLLLRASMPGLGPPAVARLSDLAAAMEAAAPGEEAADVDAFLRADREFHLASYAAAPAGETAQIIGRMWNSTQHYRRAFTNLAARGAGLGITHLEHRLLVDCIRREDPDDAERVLVTHIRRTRLELGRHPDIFA